MVKAALLPGNVPLVDKNGMINPDWHQAFTALFNRTGGTAVDKVDVAATTATSAGTAAAAAQSSADAAATAAAAAASAAAAAQGSADSAGSFASLNNSYVSGITINAVDNGSDAAINVSAHTRIYGDGTSVAVNSGGVLALVYSTPYWIYYDQASRAGGAVTYMATDTYTDAFPSPGNPDRHFVGAVETPAALDPPNDGVGAAPPGYVQP